MRRSLIRIILLKKAADYFNKGDGDMGMGEGGDGYHTFYQFYELYYHRTVLFSVICNTHKGLAWKAKAHSDGTMFEGMFIAGINTPEGQYSYHCDLPYWDMFDVPELDSAPEWDGHQPCDIKRLLSL